MHETGLARNILNIACDHARTRGASSIRSIGILLGQHAGVNAQSLAFAFEVLKQQPLTEQAELLIRQQPLRLRCEACGELGEGHAADWRCQACGTLAQPVEGMELKVEFIDIVSEPSTQTT